MNYSCTCAVVLLWHIFSSQELQSQQRQPLLGNGSANMPTARQQIHNTQQSSNGEVVFFTGSMPRLYNGEQLQLRESLEIAVIRVGS
jgi:hypothetical protein